MYRSKVEPAFTILVNIFDHITDQSIFWRVLNKRVLLCKTIYIPDNHRDKEACKKKGGSLHT